MRDPYIVRRKRSSLEAGYLKRITEQQKKIDEGKIIISEWLRLYKTNTVKSLIEKSEDFIKD